LRFIRLFALGALLIGTAVFHVRGSGYVTLRIIYFAVIAAVIVASITTRHRGGPGRRGPGPGEPHDAGSPENGIGRGGFGSPPSRPVPPPPSRPPASWPPQPPTAFPENPDPESEP
jgi:hypothetical protein